MPRKRKSFNAEFKTNVVLEVISGQKRLASACCKYNTKDTMLSRWKQKFMATGGASVQATAGCIEFHFFGNDKKP